MQSHESELANVDRRFFNGLAGRPAVLDELLADGFLLIDVFSGTEITKSALLTVIRSGELKFDKIKLIDQRVRCYDDSAVVTGWTRMQGRVGDESFEVSSRYTHVYAKLGDEWQLVSAQGTQTQSVR
jgi:hypothetical protein